MIPSRRSGWASVQLLGVGTDAGERRLEVVADPAQEVVLRGIELDQLAVLGLHGREQLRIPDGRRHRVGEQLEQVLVGRLPAAGGGQPPDEHADVRPTRAHHGPQRPRHAGHDLLFLDDGWVADDHRRVDQREHRRRVLHGPIDQRLHVVARRDLVDRRQDPPELPVAPPKVGGQSIVALGQARELVVARDADRRREIAHRHPVDGGRDGTEWRRQLVRERVGGEDREREHDGDGEQQQGTKRLVGREDARQPSEDQDRDPERGERQHRGHDEGDREAGAEAQSRGRFRWALVVSHEPRSPGCRVSRPVDSRHRAPSGHVAGGSRRPRPSGAGGAS